MDSQTTDDSGLIAEVGARPAIRVAIADDNAVVRMGIRSLLSTADDVVVVGEAGDGLAAVALAKAKKPDVMLLDVRMPRQDGVVSAREVTEHASVLMLTYSDSAEVISAAVQAGALGYLVQVNGSSLTGRHGLGSRELAWRLLESGEAALVASDGHRQARPPQLDEAYALARDRLGPVADRLFDGSALALAVRPAAA